MPSASPTRQLSAAHLELLIRQAAEHFSDVRKMEQLFWEHRDRLQHLRDIPSPDQATREDWINACAFQTLQILEGTHLNLAEVPAECYAHLEGVWLKRVKQLKAFYIWKYERGSDAENNYFEASNRLRKLLLDRPRLPMGDFDRIRSYLEDRYLIPASNAKLDDTKPEAKMLIARKASRIWNMKGGEEKVNWFRARRYVTLFYENIIGAVVEDDERKTQEVLRAFEFSKTPANRYLIVNGFEAAIAVHFLNKEVLHRVLESPALYDLSLEPMDDWPEPIAIPDGLTYDPKEKQLSYQGVMTEDERTTLLAALHDQRHRDAIEHLYQQSRQGPFEEQIL